MKVEVSVALIRSHTNMCSQTFTDHHYQFIFQSGGEVLEFILTATHEVDIVRKTEIINGPSTNRYGGVGSPAGCSH